MTKKSPLEETSGMLSASYFLLVEVDDKKKIEAAAGEIEDLLRAAVRRSEASPGSGVRLDSVSNYTPPPESDYRGWTVVVNCGIDLDVWNEAFGPGQTGAQAADAVAAALRGADLSGTQGTVLAKVETKLLVHAPS
ncbi:hypothetical protein [Streptomyces griseoaurantiacus]|uniref:hypothetical protein n=1 Tax=Streptomyces griseoaurantiacus TaxID=68213 RepID=UPI0036986F3D